MIPLTNTPHTLGRKGLATEVTEGTEEETDALGNLRGVRRLVFTELGTGLGRL